MATSNINYSCFRAFLATCKPFFVRFQVLLHPDESLGVPSSVSRLEVTMAQHQRKRPPWRRRRSRSRWRIGRRVAVKVEEVEGGNNRERYIF